jgi:hypothetical protein
MIKHFNFFLISAIFLLGCNKKDEKLVNELKRSYLISFPNAEYSAQIAADCYADKFNNNYEEYIKSSQENNARVSYECDKLIELSSMMEAYNFYSKGFLEFSRKFIEAQGKQLQNEDVFYRITEKQFDLFFSGKDIKNLGKTKQSIYFLGCAMAYADLQKIDEKITKGKHPKDSTEWCSYLEQR